MAISRKRQSRNGARIHSRLRTIEPLEDRRVLATLVVTTGDDFVTGSLREAVAIANSTAGVDTIQFDPGITGLTVELLGPELMITESVHLDASSLPQPLTISAAGADLTPNVNDGAGIRILHIDDGSDVDQQLIQIDNIRFDEGDVSGDGGAVLSRESLILRDVQFTNNHATGDGGALMASVISGATLEATNTSFVVNQSGESGGALYLIADDGSTAAFYDSYLAFNNSGRDGGAAKALVTNFSNLVVNDTIAFANSAALQGGAVHVRTTVDSDTEVTATQFFNNTSGAAGGALYSYTSVSGRLTIADSTMSVNSAGSSGGGWNNVSLSSGIVDSTNSLFSQNTAATIGGGINNTAFGGRISLDSFDATDNFTRGNGGGVYARVSESDGLVTITEANIVNNSSESLPGQGSRNGGGLHMSADNGGGAYLIGLTVESNSAVGLGGGINMDAQNGASIVLTDSTINGNSAFAGGGGVYARSSNGGQNSISGIHVEDNETQEEIGGGIGGRASFDGLLNIFGSRVQGNASRFGGGIGIFSVGGEVTLDSNTVHDNTADGNGGGVLLASFQQANMVVKNSTISANSASQTGGGVSVSTSTGGTAQIQNTTVSGNSAHRQGGGINISGSFMFPDTVEIQHSTIANNSLTLPVGYQAGGAGMNSIDFIAPVLSHNIVADNLSGGAANDLQGDFAAEFNLIETDADFTFTGSGNIIGTDPALLPLADNGGLTETHSFALTSAALNTGDPNISDAPSFDQRGAGFSRTEFGRVDIGALEFENAPSGDFNADGIYDCHDIDALVAVVASDAYLVEFDMNLDGALNLADVELWLAEAGSVNLASGNDYLFGDANLDGFVDGLDFIIWNDNRFMPDSGWCGGDFNADGVTDGLDFIVWNENRFQSANTIATESSTTQIGSVTIVEQHAREDAPRVRQTHVVQEFERSRRRAESDSLI